MNINIECAKCGSPMEGEYWILGSDARLKVRPCPCAKLCTDDCAPLETCKADLKTAKKENTKLQERYNVLVRKLKGIIDGNSTGA